MPTVIPNPKVLTAKLSVVGEGGSTPAVYQIRPLDDSRWNKFLLKHPRASVFHTVAWLKSLHRTYGYEPVAFTTSPVGQELQNALVACRVDSWLTGRRLVSLPFSDHCEPLIDGVANRNAVMASVQRELTDHKLAYIEIR